MRIAALYDIHGNLPALEAVLAEVRAAQVDAVLVGGDVLPGPMPRGCLEALAALDGPVHYIRGNGEREVLAKLAGRPTPAVPEAFWPALRWSGAQLTEAQRAQIAAWPLTHRLDRPGLGPVLCCHATPRNDYEVFTRLTPAARLRSRFDAVEAALVLCGHTHMPFDRQIGTTRVVNAGSVGMPFGLPGADWLLLDGPDVLPQHTDYDRTKAAQVLTATGYPGVEAFVQAYVLSPPSAEAMTAALEQQALR